MAAKVLITGLPNTGKTSLLKTLENALVFSRDGKPFPFSMPHVNIPDQLSEKGKNIFQVDYLVELVGDKLELYFEKFNKYPETIIFDSVSRIFTDIETSSSNKFSGYDVWSNVNKEINEFLSFINLLNSDDYRYNIILIAHATFNSDSKKFEETCKGSFNKTGGFLSTVDYSINIDLVGKKRIVTHRGMNLSRCLNTDIPDSEDVNSFNLQEYVNKINNFTIDVQKWTL